VSGIYYNVKQNNEATWLLYATKAKVVHAVAEGNKLDQALGLLRAGKDPLSYLPKDAVIINTGNITSIEHIPVGDGIRIRHRVGRKVKSTFCVGHDDLQIAENLAGIAGMSLSPITRISTFREISFLPAATMLMVGPGAAIAVALALNWNPAEVNMNRPKARMFADLMGALGETGICAIAAIAVPAVLVWWAVIYIRRPVVTIFKRPDDTVFNMDG